MCFMGSECEVKKNEKIRAGSRLYKRLQTRPNIVQPNNRLARAKSRAPPISRPGPDISRELVRSRKRARFWRLFVAIAGALALYRAIGPLPSSPAFSGIRWPSQTPCCVQVSGNDCVMVGADGGCVPETAGGLQVLKIFMRARQAGSNGTTH